jgi:hypothetical protein
MIYLGDYAEDATIDFKWSTNAADGASITRATNGTVSVYKANNTTQSTAGVTDTEDFDSLTGIHHCRIDTSADAFYATGNDYAVVLSGATIDGESVNAVLALFSIQNRYQDKTNYQLADGAITAAKIGADAITAAKVASDVSAEIADAVWDEALSGHTTAGSAGKAMSDAQDGDFVAGSATAATNAARGFQGLVLATAVTGTLTATAFTTSLTEATNDHYNGRTLTFTSGNLAGQMTTITDYNGTTKVVTVTAMTEAPANGDQFFIA